MLLCICKRVCKVASLRSFVGKKTININLQRKTTFLHRTKAILGTINTTTGHNKYQDEQGWRQPWVGLSYMTTGLCCLQIFKTFLYDFFISIYIFVVGHPVQRALCHRNTFRLKPLRLLYDYASMNVPVLIVNTSKNSLFVMVHSR